MYINIFVLITVLYVQIKEMNIFKTRLLMNYKERLHLILSEVIEQQYSITHQST